MPAPPCMLRDGPRSGEQHPSTVVVAGVDRLERRPADRADARCGFQDGCAFPEARAMKHFVSRRFAPPRLHRGGACLARRHGWPADHARRLRPLSPRPPRLSRRRRAPSRNGAVAAKVARPASWCRLGRPRPSRRAPLFRWICPRTTPRSLASPTCSKAPPSERGSCIPRHCALGMSADHGARHLAQQAGDRDAWRAFCGALDAAAPYDPDAAATAAAAAFDAARAAFADHAG